MVNVQTYGAGLWHTWFDRDLSVAGRVIVRSGSNTNSYLHKLVKIKRPLLRIPTLAIHLDRYNFCFHLWHDQACRFCHAFLFVSLFSTVNQDGFKPNLETHLLPLLSVKPDEISSESKDKTTAALSSKASHHPLLMQVPIFLSLFQIECEVFLNKPPCSWIWFELVAFRSNFVYCNCNHAYPIKRYWIHTFINKKGYWLHTVSQKSLSTIIVLFN